MQKRKIPIILGVVLIGLLALSLANEAPAIELTALFHWDGASPTPVDIGGGQRQFTGTLLPNDIDNIYTMSNPQYNATLQTLVNNVVNCTLVNPTNWIVGVGPTRNPPYTVSIIVQLPDPLPAWYSLRFRLFGDETVVP